MLNANIIGKRIKSRKEELNIDNDTLCKEVGISQSALSMYENGMRVARDEIKPKLARALNMTIEALFFAE